MSLREAVAAIADQMERDAKAELEGSSFARQLRSYVQLLRIAVQAAGSGDGAAGQIVPETKAAAEVTARMRETRKRLLAEDGGGERLAEIVDGPAASLVSEEFAGLQFHVIPSGMPVGAFLNLMGVAYQLQDDRKLHYHEVETARMRAVTGRE